MRIRRAFSVLRLGPLWFGLAALAAKDPPPTRLDLPPPLQAVRTISAQELLLTTQKLLPKGAFLGPLLDERYAVIKHDWMVRKFIPFYRESVALMRAATEGADEGADCDDFGMFLRHQIGLAGMLGGNAQPSAAKVVAFQSKAFSGVGRTRERHAIGLFLTEKGWYVLEPQNPASFIPLESYPNRAGLQYITFH